MNLNLIFIYSFIFLLITVTMVKLYLSWRNIRHVRENINQVPPEFQDVVGHSDHLKAGKYTIAKSKLAIFSLLFSTFLTVMWLFLGGLQYLTEFSKSLGLTSIVEGVVLILIFSFLQSCLTLPISIYSTFKIEEDFGFNKMTPKLYVIDLIKGTLISLVIGVPLLFGILWTFESLGTYWWAYTWAFMVIFQIVMVWAYPKFISPLFNKFSPLDDQNLSYEIDKLCERSELEFNDYFVMDASKRSSHGNAYFTGFGKNKRIVFFDTLMNSLNHSEIIAVLAHELGHFKKKHIQKMILTSFLTLLIGFYILGLLSQSEFFYSTFDLERSNAIALLLFMLVAPYYTFVATPFSSWLSRKHEFEADEFAANKASAKNLIDALLKMYRDNSSTLTPDPLYSKFYFSHPPAKERVAFLKSFLDKSPASKS